MNYGISTELKIIKSYDNKTFNQLNNFQKEIITRMFPKVKDGDIISCKKFKNSISKPDIVFYVGGMVSYVSVKSGSADGMHIEEIRTFIWFLRRLGISIRTQKILLLYHYGDGTLDGSGKRRMLLDEIVYKYKDLIAYANNELKAPEIVLACLIRFVFKGSSNMGKPIDYLFFGDETYGVLCSKNDLTNFVLSRNYSHLSTMHVGPLTIQPYLRDINNVSKYKYKRDMVQIKWRYLLTDLQKANSMKHIIYEKMKDSPYYDIYKE